MSMSTPALSASAAASTRSAATPCSDQLGDGVVVADDDARRSRARRAASPCSSARVGGHRDAGDVGEGRHDRRDAGRHRRLEGGQMDLAHVRSEMSTEAYSRPAVTGAIGAEMLGDGGERIGRGEIGALEAPHLGLRDARRRARGPRPGPRRCGPSAGRARRRASARRSWRGRRPRPPWRPRARSASQALGVERRRPRRAGPGRGCDGRG